MFGIDSSEFLLIAVVALLVIGPKDLPRVMRLVGGWVGRGRAMTRHLRSGFDTMMREAELEEMQKQWAKQNADIMAAAAVSPVPVHSYQAMAVMSGTTDAPNIDDMTVVDRGALSGGTAQISDSGNRGDDGAAVMTGPQPLALGLEPAIPLEPTPGA